MWTYEKMLEYPVKIKNPSPKMAKIIVTQYGGPDGELGAALRYLSQKFSMITPQAIATLNDIGTEELAHLEMVGAMVTQLMKGASLEQIEKEGMIFRRKLGICQCVPFFHILPYLWRLQSDRSVDSILSFSAKTGSVLSMNKLQG